MAPKQKDKMAEDAVSNEQANTTEKGKEEAMNTELTTDANTARLMITKIVNENFKSYAGIQELGPFHKVNTRLESNRSRIFPHPCNTFYHCISTMSLIFKTYFNGLTLY